MNMIVLQKACWIGLGRVGKNSPKSNGTGSLPTASFSITAHRNDVTFLPSNPTQNTTFTDSINTSAIYE